MANIKHTVVIRKDLNLTEGMIAAQTAHISDEFMRRKIIEANGDGVPFSETEFQWMKNPYIAVLRVDNPEELEYLMERAKDAGINVNEWHDIIRSPNLGIDMPGVFIGASFGPCDSDEIKAITGNLKLV